MNGSSVISRLKGAELRIDRICRRFEQSWRQNRPVSIEHCLREVEPLERPRLLEELIAAEWELRLRRGEVPSAGDYLDRFSEHGQLVETICGVMQFEFGKPEMRPQKLLPQEGDHLGDYRIIREVGRGGMGIVFEARQESLGRQVALKVLPARRFQNERELLRFRREAQSVARLHHSNIVEIYGVGEQEGVHYFAMRFIVGRSLDEVIRVVTRRLSVVDAKVEKIDAPETPDESSSSATIQPGSGFFDKAFTSPEDSIDSTNDTARFRAVARIGRQVAEALQYAHDRGILHRDVKPSNLILDRQEVCWLSDFGLAKVHLEAAEITESDDLIGTLKYMSPEALSGTMDERSDLYSLGLTLYELATLHPVLDAVDRGQLLEQVKDPHPVPPRRFAPEIPRDLETVILKAMTVDPNQRYRTAAELADDLGRFLNHEPIKARPQSTWTKLRRWVERKPLLAFLALGTMSITATSLFSFASLYFSARQTAFHARQERDRANLLRDEAEVSRQATDASRKTAELLTIDAQHQLIQVQRSKAATRLQHGDDFGSLVWTAETLRLLENVTPSPLDSNEPRANRKAGPVSVVDPATDRTAGNRAPSPLDRSGHLDLEPTLRLRAGAVAQFAPRVIRRVWLPRVIHKWSSLTSENIDVRRHSWNEDRILFDTSGQRLILANSTHTRQIQWDLPTGQFQASLPPESSGTFVYTKGGEARFVYGKNRRLTYVPTDSDSGPRTLEIPAGHAIQRPLGAWQSVDKKYLLVSFQCAATLQTKGSDSLAWLWDLNSGFLANALPLLLDDKYPEIEFSRDCRRLFVRSNRSVQVVELAGWKPLLSNAHIDPATTAWSRDGKWLALKSGVDTALYRIGSSANPTPQLIESPGLHGIRFEESGGGMALRMQRGHIEFLSIGEEQKAQFRDFSHPHEVDIRDFNYSPDGQWYALAYNDGDVRIWSVHYNQPITGLMRHSSAVTSVAWSPNGDLLGTLTQDGLLTVWDVRPACATGQIFFHPTAGRLNTVRISPDGSRVAAGGTQGNPAIWNLTTGQLDCLPVLNGAALYNSGDDGSDAKTGDSRAIEAAAASRLSLKETKRLQQDQVIELRRNPHAIEGFPNPEIQRLDWNDKGGLLAAICGNRKYVDGTASENLMLRVWESQHGLALPVRAWPYRTRPGRISMPQFTNDDRLLTHSTSHADLTGWRHGSAHVRFQTESKGWLAFTRLSADERFLAVARDAGIVSLFRVSDGKLVAKFSLPAKQEIQDLTFNQSGTQLAVVGKFGLQVWDTTTGDALKQPEDGPFIRLQQVSFSPDDRHIATITENHVCQIHDTATWERSATTFQLESRPILAKFNPDNQTFLTVTETGILQIWDWSRGELLTPPLRNVQSIQDADLSRDGTKLAVMSPNAVRVWKLPQPDRRSVSKIAEWARDVTLTTVDVEESTLVPLLPKQFPDHIVGHFKEQDSDSPFTTSARTLWHVHQAKEAFLNMDEVAAEFHILRLKEIAPAHSELESLRQLKNRLPRW